MKKLPRLAGHSDCGRTVLDPAAGDSVPCSIAPWLSVRNSVQAVDFYKSAFGATEVYRLEMPGGGVVAKRSVDGAEFWLRFGIPRGTGCNQRSCWQAHRTE